RPLVSAEIGIIDQPIGVDDTNDAHPSEVKPLGYHLGTHQHIVPLFVKCSQHPFKTIFPLGRVEVEAAYTRTGQQGFQFLLYPLGAEPLALDMGGAARRTHLERCFCKSAIVAVQLAAALMVGKAHITVDAFSDVATGFAL